MPSPVPIPVAPPEKPSPVTPGRFRKLLVRAFLLGAPFALFLLGFEWQFARLQPSHYAAKKRLLERQAARTEILVMGPSHAFTGVEPADLGRPAFNLAGNSQSLYYDAALIRKYLPSLPALRLVVLPISFMSLGYELDQSSERWRCYYYRYFFGLPHRDWHMSYSARNYLAWFLCGSEISRADVLFGKAGSPLNEYDAWGGWTNRPSRELSPDAQAAYLRRSAGSALKRHLSGMRTENVLANAELLRSLIRELESRGVQVLLVTLPATSYYRDQMPAEAYERMQAALQELSKQCNVTYRNYLFDPRFEEFDFEDGDHLNSLGAHKFSGMLAQEIRELRPGRGKLAGAVR